MRSTALSPHFIVWFLLALLVLPLPACSKTEAGAAKEPPPQADSVKPLAIGVLIPGSKSDKGWMESGYDGLTRAESKHGAKIKVD